MKIDGGHLGRALTGPYIRANRGEGDPIHLSKDHFSHGHSDELAQLRKSCKLSGMKTAVSRYSKANLEKIRGSQRHLAVHAAQNVGASVAQAARTGKTEEKQAIPLRPGQILRDPEDAAFFVDKFTTDLNLPDSRKLRNQIMCSSAAKFLRVNPALFFKDVKGVYSPKANLLDRKAPQIIIAGDCHLGNLGTIRSPQGETIWGINDYDMAGKGSPEFDLERMATSFMLMGRDSKISDHDLQRLVKKMAKSYMDEIAKNKDAKPGEVLPGLRNGSGPVKELITKQSKVTQEEMLARFADKEQDKFVKLQRNQKLQETSTREKELLGDFLKKYDRDQGRTPGLKRPLEILDLARRLDSGGSTFGLHRYYILLKGSNDGPPIILEIKQELPTAPETETGDLKQASAVHIFRGMEAMGGTPDPMMSRARIDGYAYFIREREKEKGDIDPATLKSDGWEALVECAGKAMARAHAHQGGAAAAIHKWIGDDQNTLIENLQEFATTYADQTRKDCRAYATLTETKMGTPPRN